MATEAGTGQMTKESLRDAYRSIKKMSLNHLSAKQHSSMALCRDVSMLPPVYYTFMSLKKAWQISIQTTIKLYEPQSLRESLIAFWQTYMVANISDSVQFSNLRTMENVTQHNVNNTSAENWESVSFTALTKARASEHLFCALWCLVSLYLTYAILDSLMVRWIVKYSTSAAILRMFSMSMIIITFESMLLASLSPEKNYFLHTWITISCILTAVYIWQSYLTSDLNYVRNKKLDINDIDVDDEIEGINGQFSYSTTIEATPDNNSEYEVISNEDSPSQINQRRLNTIGSQQSRSSTPTSATSQRRSQKRNTVKSIDFTTKRYIDLYNITVFCVVPVGIASFITMVGLSRNLFIQRLDVEQLGRMLHESYNP